MTIESQMELDEAVRILHQNEEAEMDIHVFLGTPAQPGLPCQGEDSRFYCDCNYFLIYGCTAHIKITL